MTKFLWGGLVLSLFLVSCGGNPAWTRDGDSEDPAMVLAEQACQCIYDVLDEEEDIDASQVVSETEAWKLAVQGRTPEDADLKETLKLVNLDPTLSQKVDESECMSEIEDELFNKGIPFEEMMKLIDENCKLGLFYN